jgi:hypothetical protein
MGEDAVELVARIIDPDAWHEKLPADGCGVYWSNRRASAKQKAQSIVAAMPQPTSTVEAGDADGKRLAEDLRLVRAIRWKSVEKDNMEFEARITCYQREAIERIAARLEKDND